MALADPVPQTPRYVSPYGKPRGLRARLVAHRKALSTPGNSWHGTGIIDDMELIMAILDKREWLEAMRLSDDPDAQRFAAELLDDNDTLDAVQAAADSTKTPIAANTAESAYRQATYDPPATIEQLDAAAAQAQQSVRAMRAVLERSGVVDDETPDEMLPDLLQALLA